MCWQLLKGGMYEQGPTYEAGQLECLKEVDTQCIMPENSRTAIGDPKGASLIRGNDLLCMDWLKLH